MSDIKDETLRPGVHAVCPLCGSDDVQTAMRCIDHFVTGEAFTISRCGHCGFHFTSDAPAEDEIGRYYRSGDYISHSDTSRGVVNKVYHLVRRYMLREKAGIVMHYTGKRRGRLLDYGAGTGYFANRMQRAGWQTEAIEPGDAARAFAFARFGLRMKMPSDLSRMEDKSFDCITLWHVLEHVAGLHETMDEMARLLADDGILVVAVPNRTSCDARHYGSLWAAWDVPRRSDRHTDAGQRTRIQPGRDAPDVLRRLLYLDDEREIRPLAVAGGGWRGHGIQITAHDTRQQGARKLADICIQKEMNDGKEA